MPIEPPPSRFRVVERGRRLEVIDTQATASSASAAAPAQRDREPGAWPRRTRFDGTIEFTTRSFYDTRGPRTVTLDPGAAQQLGLARWGMAAGAIGAAFLLATNPWLLLAGVGLAHPKLRERLRAWSTALVDKAVQR